MDTLTDNALKLLNARYLLRDNEGMIVETPSMLFRRTAKEVARAELEFGNSSEAEYWEEQFYTLMSELYFLPNSPTLMNAGTNLNQLSACFVLPLEKDIGDIFKTLKETLIIQQSNGGTGFNFSELSSLNLPLTNEKTFSLGPIETIEIFDTVIQKMKQYSKRAGANIGVLNVNHPDIEAFIQSKNDECKFQNFNISVGVTDKFMKAVEEDKSWKQEYGGKVIKKTKARKIWKQIVENAWQRGDPGLLFLDEIERKNPLPFLGRMKSTNPCGEVPLMDYEACNLGSINLAKLVHKNSSGKTSINWVKLEFVVNTSIRFLDNVISANNYLLPEIQKVVHGNRKIGLGLMGWAEMLIHLNIPYQSPKAIILASKLMQFINKKAHEASGILAKERGVFPNWKKSIYYKKQLLRNATCTSIAPTGSIAIIANTTPSIEPLFALAFTRENVLGNKTLIELNTNLIEKLETYKLHSKDLEDEIKETGKLPKNKNIPKPLKELFLTAHEIDIKTHILHQNAFQKYTDNAVSKTINFPESAKAEDVSNAYKFAWKYKLKGITIYRHGSRKQQVMTAGIGKKSMTACDLNPCID